MTTRIDNALSIVKSAHIIQRLYTTPLVSEFGGSVPIKQPIGRLFFLSRSPLKKFDDTLANTDKVQNAWGLAPENSKPSEYKFEVIHKDIEMKTQKVKTSWTQEALQDYTALFVEKPLDEISKTLAGELTNEAIFQLDQEFVKFASNEAKKIEIPYTSIQTNSKFDMCFNIVELIYKHSADMISMLHNKSSVSVLLSKDLCSILMSHPHFKPHEKLDGTLDDDNLFFIGRIHNIKIFNDYYNFLKHTQDNKQTSSSILIGVKDLHNEVNSSVVYCPYQSTLNNEINPDSAENSVFLWHSYGLSMCPQHSNETPMLQLIEITGAKENALEVHPQSIDLGVSQTSKAITIENTGGDFNAVVVDDKIATFNKANKTITAKNIEGSTQIRIKAQNGQSSNILVNVTKPKIKLSNANILLDQEDTHVLDIVLENADDYEFSLNTPNIVTFNKDTKTLQASDTLSGDVILTLTPKLQNNKGDAVEVKIKVIELPQTQLNITKE